MIWQFDHEANNGINVFFLEYCCRQLVGAHECHDTYIIQSGFHALLQVRWNLDVVVSVKSAGRKRSTIAFFSLAVKKKKQSWLKYLQ